MSETNSAGADTGGIGAGKAQLGEQAPHGPAGAGPEAQAPQAAQPPEDEARDDALEAMAALRSDEGAREVGDPDPQTLEPGPDWDGGPASLGSDLPDAAPRPAGPGELDEVEMAAMAAAAYSPSQTVPFAPVKPTSPSSAIAADRISGAARGTGALAWGSRSDVGLVRPHNEDSFVIRFPMFAVADGMGGHAAGEVASTIAVSSLATAAPDKPDDQALGAAIETANLAVIDGAASGLGRPGMGTTCTAVVIDGDTMAVGHVGDSRCYVLHAGQLVRVTHDHSYVEELVAAGQLTPEEARVHPNRSIITRALGNDPAMKADHFLVGVSRGDRVLLCTDGLSSMVPDDQIEEAMVSSPAPQACADALVELALKAGGHDNVTCVVIDVKDDGVASHAVRARLRSIGLAALIAAAILLAAYLGLHAVSQRYWYLADQNGYVAIYQGFPNMQGLGLSRLVETTSVRTDLLSDAVAARLERGVSCDSEDEARAAVESYREQVEASRPQASQAASSAAGSSAAGSSASATAASDGSASAAVGSAEAASSSAASGQAAAADAASGAAAPAAPEASAAAPAAEGA